MSPFHRLGGTVAVLFLGVSTSPIQRPPASTAALGAHPSVNLGSVGVGRLSASLRTAP